MTTETAPARERTAGETLLQMENVSVDYRASRFRPPHRAVDGVSLAIGSAETLAVVGESGSGKTSIAKAVLGLVPVTTGQIWFGGQEISRWQQRQRKSLADELQIVYQDPYRALSPTRTVGQSLAEPLLTDRALGTTQVRQQVTSMLEHVGLSASASTKHPGELSGGERQRVVIARALMRSPRLVLCDEPVSSLDVSIQAQILNLLGDLQHRLSLSYLFISHNIAVVRYFADRVLVLYSGQVMEVGPAEMVSHLPAHPYTRMLIDAVPDYDPAIQSQRRRMRRPVATSGQVTAGPTAGCVFAARCPYVIDICREVRPSLEPVWQGGPLAACHRATELRLHQESPPAVGPDLN
jgi:oligopeptide/dipeptide ABC transporter ATP-binding protein